MHSYVQVDGCVWTPELSIFRWNILIEVEVLELLPATSAAYCK